MEAICRSEQNFSYRFGKETLTNVSVPEGLYRLNHRGNLVVVGVDRFGELRVSLDTPVANCRGLAKQILKNLRKGRR